MPKRKIIGQSVNSLMNMDKFNLKWNDFQSNVSRSFDVLRQAEDFFDVTLVSDDEEHISAHKLVLSASSDFFRNILRKASHSNPMIYLHGFGSKELQFVMDYIYLGEIQVLQDDLDGFLNATQKLKIKGLTQRHGSMNDKVPHNEQSLREDDALFLKDPTNRGVDNNILQEKGSFAENFLNVKCEVEDPEEEEYLEDNTHGYEVGGDFNVNHITKHGRRRNHPDKTRNLQCNFCGYSTQKMSNIKVHVKKVHKRIERGPEDQGFTILFI